MNPSTPIDTIQQLHAYLRVAIQLEHATIPPYLTAGYTAKIESNRAAIDHIVAVAKEEMLHLTLAANLLNAVGGTPDILYDGFVPSYPCHLPSGATDFEVSIEKFSERAIETFLMIERPEWANDSDRKVGRVRQYGDIQYIERRDLQEDTRGLGRGLLPYVRVQEQGQEIELHYWSIGAFYNAIRDGFKHLTDQGENLFSGDKAKQVNPKYYFSAGGDLTEIVSLETALAAIELIATQGEGYTDEVHDVQGELAHYYRFEQITRGRYYLQGNKPHQPQGKDFPRDYSAVFPIKKNAKIADYQGCPEIERQARLFNGCYKQFLQRLNQAFNGKPEIFRDDSLYAEMYQLKREMEYLIRNPLPETGENAAPTFQMDACICPHTEE